MSVYVDDARIPWRGTRWCHMTADSVEELREFASRIGLRPEWYQPSPRPEACHFDLAPSFVAKALAAGAIAETTREGAIRRRAARKAQIPAPAQPADLASA